MPLKKTLDPSSGIRPFSTKAVSGITGCPCPARREAGRSSGHRRADMQQQPLLAAFGGHSLIPIATPLSLGGFHRETLKSFRAAIPGDGHVDFAGSRRPDRRRAAKADAGIRQRAA